MKNKSKIILGITSFFVAVVLVCGVIWFSMASEERNIILFMMMKGERYDNYQEYQVIDRNNETLAPTSFKP